MEIEKIETRECESALGPIVLAVLATIMIILSVRLISGILSGEETKTIGTLIGTLFVVLAMTLGALKKGYIGEEVVTAIE